MGHSKTLNADARNINLFELRNGTADVFIIAEDREDIEIELATPDAPDSRAGQAVDNSWGEIVGARYELFVESVQGAVVYGGGVSYGNGGVQINSFSSGGISVSSVDEDVVIVGNRVYIGGKEQVPDSRGGTGQVRVIARVPRGLDLRVETRSGDVTTTGSFDTVEVDSTSGSLKVDAANTVAGQLSSGSLRVGYVHRRISCRTSSGDIRVQEARGYVDLQASSGDVRVRKVFGNGQITTSSGDITVDGFEGESLNLRASSGDIEHPEVPGIHARVSSGRVNGVSARRGRW